MYFSRRVPTPPAASLAAAAGTDDVVGLQRRGAGGGERRGRRGPAPTDGTMTIAASHGASPRRDALFARATPTSTAALAATILVGALAWTWLVRLPLFRMDCLDDAGYVGLAHFWTRGVLPYARIFDFKPPGLFALVALAQSAFGPTLESLRAVAIASDALAATGLFFLARRFGRPAVGLFAAALYPILSEIAIGNDAYCPLAALTILAFLAALSPLSPLRRSVLAGLAIGAAATVKQTAGFEAVALLAILTLAPDAAPGRVRAALAFILAAALAPLGFLLYFAWRGAAGALIADTVVGALARPASASEGLSFAGGLLRFLPLQKGLLPLTGLCVLALVRARALAAAAPRFPLGAVWAWFAAACVSVIVQRSFAQSYLGPMLAPALLLAGFCVAQAAPEMARIPQWARLGALALLSLAAALAAPGVDFVRRQDVPALAAAARAIDASGPAPEDRLYVVNRGAWLASMLDLAPPTEYFFPFQTLCAFPGAGADGVAQILAARPRYIVVADRRLKYACELPESWRLIDQALAGSYRLLARAKGDFDSYDVYEALGARRAGG